MTQTTIRNAPEEAEQLIHGALSQACTFADAYNLWQYLAGYMDALSRVRSMQCELKTDCESGQ